jgi:EmrB/QacA subfamily drug resistance transporter
VSELRERPRGGESPVAAEAADEDRIPPAVWAAASVIALGGFLGNMDSSIVAVGLESMRVSLHVGLPEIQWVATAYLLGLSAALPLTPWLLRRVGAGRLWLTMLAGFVFTSVGCALAPAAFPLVAARAVQGMTAGVLVAAGQAVIGLAVGPQRLGRMMGTLGLVVGLAPIAGPSAGGFLLARFSWPMLFWLNVPIGAVAFVLGLRFVPRDQQEQPSPMDWPGLALISLGLPLLVYALTELGTPGNTAIAPYLVLAVLGFGALAGFVWWSRRDAHPVVQLRLAANPIMASGLITVLLAGASTFGAVLLFPLWFQIRLSAGSAAAGLMLVPLGLGTTLIVPIAGRLADRYGGGTISLIGSLAVLLSTVPWSWLLPGTPILLVQILLLVRGVGNGLSMMPATTAAYASVRPADVGDATTLVNIGMRVGGAIGGALCLLVLSHGLASTATTGFHAAFVVLGVLSLLASGASGWLCHAEFQHRTTPVAAREKKGIR